IARALVSKHKVLIIDETIEGIQHSIFKDIVFFFQAEDCIRDCLVGLVGSEMCIKGRTYIRQIMSLSN
ncbi:hypothetical protein, partial [Pseudomonas syringae]|uniref:hypothetical protein n=1 Tax=Pseudomonas syringae TaxID=317 RepID=UPI003AF385CA